MSVISIIPITVGEYGPRSRMLPCWFAYSPVFPHLGRKSGYTPRQAEMRVAIAVVWDVITEDRTWAVWRSRRRA